MASKAKSKTKNKSGTSGADEFWGHIAEEIPRADVESINRADRRAKFMRIYVGSSVVLLPIALLAAISFVPSLLEPTPELVAPVSEINSPTKALAIQTVENWLQNTPEPLPGGRILSWDGVKVQQEPSITIDPTNNRTVEKVGLQLHSLTLVAPSGALYTASIQVGYSEVRGAQTVGPPSFIPRAPDDAGQWPTLTSWPSLVAVTPGDSVSQSVTAWANAYASGDPNVLRLAVGDEASNHSYVPLVQAKASDTKVETAGAIPLSDGKTPPTNPATVVARVSFGVEWAGAAPAKEGSSSQPARLSYDVLIQRADTASPVVVAWGGLGTGEALKAYQNAVVDREIKKDAVEGPTDLKNR